MRDPRLGVLAANLLIAGIVVVAYRAISSGSPLLIAGLVLLPVGLYFINNPVHLLMATFLIGAAGLTLPGIPGGLSLQVLLQLVNQLVLIYFSEPCHEKLR